MDPFLKWPGGKRWLTTRHAHLFPVGYTRYVEPFLGGGAVFFSLLPKKAVLSDSNADLINAYQQIRLHWRKIEKALSLLHADHSAKLYYATRAQVPTDPLRRAIRFIYLNRTCFNGIYRVNLKGFFNVPVGSKTAISYPPNYLEQIADALGRAKVSDSDFESTINDTRAGDFVYVDPPYTVLHNNNGFVKYNAKLFSWTDQARLATTIKAAARRGAKIMLSNADHPTVRELYSGFGEHRSLDRHSVLASDSVFRRSSTELLITNY